MRGLPDSVHGKTVNFAIPFSLGELPAMKDLARLRHGNNYTYYYLTVI